MRENNILEVVSRLYSRYIQLYKATSGAIFLEKSLFYHWKWTFKNRKREIQDLSFKNDYLLIDQTEVFTGTITLGMKLEPDLLFNDTTDFIIVKIDKFTTKI